MSAYSNLVGLYPTTGNLQLPEQFERSLDWPKSLPWQPIPVHTVDKSLDHVLFDCLR